MVTITGIGGRDHRNTHQLLRPFPDELLGSALLRASRSLGLPSRRLLRAIKGLHSDTMPVLLTQDRKIAQAFGLSLGELLFGHTLLPYAFAYREPAAREQLQRTKLDSNATVGMSPAFHSLTKFSSYLRFCSQCVAADFERFGTSYWHRVHQLPGVVLCAHHAVPLLLSGLRVFQAWKLVLPNEVHDGRVVPVLLPQDLAMAISSLSLAALRDEVPVRFWIQSYRQRAAELGFGYDIKLLAGGLLAADLRAFYGKEYLQSLGVDFDPSICKLPWPAMMLRPSKPSFTTLRHVLLNVFLDRICSASKPVPDLFSRVNRKRIDLAARECEVIRRLDELVAEYETAGKRVTLGELSTRVRSPLYLKRARTRMPLLRAWIVEFKASDVSLRKTGRRKKRRKER